MSVAFFVLAIIFDVNQKSAIPNIPAQKQMQINEATIKNQTQISTSTSTLKAKNSSKPIVKTLTTVPPPVPPIKIQIATQPPIDLATLNTQTRLALVNILCETAAGGPLSPISGSGVIVSSDGVILTVAHVAEFFLLRDFNGQKDSVQCVIRTGSPAYATYNAELIYISPIWVSQNKSILLEAVPQGTGEHDYAFLRITGKIDGTAMPVSLPFLSISLSEGNPTGQFALLASYAAGFLGGQSIVQSLFQSSAETTVQKIFTFASTTSDVLSLPGTIISQGGSSGGAVVNSEGQLEGIISTDTNASQTSARDLNAITTSYINRDLEVESGQTIADLLTFPAAYAEDFNQNIAPKLTEILTNAILQK